MTASNSFGARAVLKGAGGTFEIFRLDALERRGLPVARLPYSLRILLENLLRREDGRTVTPAEIERLARWDPTKTPDDEIAFMPARVLMQDFTGVPAVVDLAAMRDAMRGMGGDPTKVNPLLPAELVIDHSVIVDEFGTPTAFQVNADLEFQRNRERYALRRVHDRRPRAAGLSRHPRGHRLAHHDDQWARRARLGRGGDRGGSRDAGTAGLHAHPAGRGLPAHRQAERGCDRDRPRADGDGDAPQEGCGGKVRGVLRPRDRHPAPRRSRDYREHGARVRRHRGDFPGGSGDPALPRIHGPAEGAGAAGRGVHEGAGPVSLGHHDGAGVFRHPLARPLDGRAEPRRTAAAAGPGVLARSAPELPARAPSPGQALVADRAGRELGALGGRGRRRRGGGGSATPAPHPRRFAA